MSEAVLEVLRLEPPVRKHQGLVPVRPRIGEALADTGVGTKYVSEIESRVLKSIGVELSDLRSEMQSGQWTVSGRH